MFSSQAFAQHHRPPRPILWHDSIGGWHDSIPNWNDTTHVGWHHWGDFHGWLDSVRHHHYDSLNHDSIPHHCGDSSAFGWHHHWDSIPHPPHDSGHTWHDSGHTWHDSGHTWHDSMPNDTGYIDTTGWHHHGGHRIADPGNSSDLMVQIYPNPVVESAVIHIENASGNIVFTLVDETGRLAVQRTLSNGDFQLSKDHLNTGVYFYQVTDGDTPVAKGRLILQ